MRQNVLFIFSSKCIKCVWRPGSAQTCWESFSKSPNWIKGMGTEGVRGMKRRERGGKEKAGEGIVFYHTLESVLFLQKTPLA